MAGLPVLGDRMTFIGIDIHTALTPTEPPLPVLAPHVASAPLDWITSSSLTGRFANNVLTPMGRFVMRGSDVGLLIPHVPMAPVIPMLALILAGSISKSQFGVSSVRVSGASYPAAIAVLYGDALQQDCGDIAPFVGAAFGLGHCAAIANSSVLAGFTFADFVGSIAAILFESVSTWVAGKIFGALGEHAFKEIAEKLLKQVFEALTALELQLYYIFGLPIIKHFNEEFVQKFVEAWEKFTSGDDAFEWGHDAAKGMVEKLL
jgi:hypothetical protein